MYSPNAPSKRLFNLFGFPVEAELNSAIMLVLILLFYGKGGPTQMVFAAIVAFIAFVSIIAHELGHAFVTRKLGYGGSTIRLTLLGGVALSYGRRKRGDSIKISLAGPAVTAAIAGAAYALYVALGPVLAGAPMVKGALFVTAVLNAFWAVFNLLPIFPMDGGQALRTWLGMKLPERESIRRSLMISGAVAAVLIIVAFITGQYLLLIIVGWMALQNWQEWTRNFA